MIRVLIACIDPMGTGACKCHVNVTNFICVIQEENGCKARSVLGILKTDQSCQ